MKVLVVIEALVAFEVNEIDGVHEEVLAEVCHQEKHCPQVDEFVEYRSDSRKSECAEAPYPRPESIKWLKQHLKCNQRYDHL